MPSIPQLVMAAIAAVLVLASSTAAQSPAYCGYGPFNLTSLMLGPDIIFDQSNVNGPQWAVHPCGVVNGYCSSASSPASFCQGGYTVASFNASATGNAQTDYAGYLVDNEPIWTLITRSNQYGVAQIIQDGNPCGGYGSRQGTLEYLCNPTATTPYISSVLETQTCHYAATIQTNVVCNVSFAAGLASGLPLQSTTCGGGLIDLSSIAGKDLNNTAGIIINPCGSIANATNPYCYSNGLSVCQPNSNGGGVALATYAPYNFPTLYQPITNGVAQIIQDGSLCAAPYNYTENFVNISYVCDASATTPVVTIANVSTPCHYYYTVASSTLCNFSTPTAAVPASTSCTFGPYNLNSISNITMIIGTNSSTQFYNWAIRPCGDITDLGLCNGQFCQQGNVVNYWSADPSQYQALSGSDSLPIWASVTHNGQSGVAQFLQNGYSCGGNTGARQGAVYYLCNQTATVPFITSVVESPACHYTAIVQTSAVCGVSTSATQQPGVSLIANSNTCGGGIYNLAGLGDISGYNLNSNNWTVNLCGYQTTIASGCVNVSACQWGGNSASATSYASALTTYAPNTYPVIYTYLGNGVSQIIQDGPANCYGTNTERYTNITLVCNSAATTPVMVAVSESPECHYMLTIQTNVVCGQPLFLAAPGGSGASSSSGSSMSMSSMSSSAASSNSSASAMSSSSAASSNSTVAASSSSAGAAMASSVSSSAMMSMSSSSSSAAGAAVVTSSSSSSTAAAVVTQPSSSSSAATIVTQPSSSSTATVVVTPTAATSASSTVVVVESSSAVVVVASSTGAVGPSRVSGASNVLYVNAGLLLASTLAVAALLL